MPLYKVLDLEGASDPGSCSAQGSPVGRAGWQPRWPSQELKSASANYLAEQLAGGRTSCHVEEGGRGRRACGLLKLPVFNAKSCGGCERGCPPLIRAAFQPGRRKRSFCDRQVANVINIPAALGC